MNCRDAVLAALVLALAAPAFPAHAQRRAQGAAASVHQRPEHGRPELRLELGEDWDEVLIVSPVDAQGLADKHRGKARGQGKWKALKPPERADKFNWFAKLQRDPEIQELAPNYRAWHPGCRQMSIDIFETGEILDLIGQLPIQQIHGTEALAAPHTIVAVVDSGVALVEELEGRLLPPIDVLSNGSNGNPRRGRGNGQHLEADDPQAWDGNGHGTAMASLIVAVAEDVMILPVRVVGEDCIGNVYDLAEGIRLAADAGAQVISVSIGTERDSPVLREAMAHAAAQGALVIAAAGNSGVVEYPARYESAVAVTAVDAANWPASFAALGEDIDLAAPGVAIIARVPATGGPGFDYAELSGTSPATALTAAAAAVVVSRTLDETVEVRRNVLLRSVSPVRELSPQLQGEIGEGILDLLPLR